MPGQKENIAKQGRDYLRSRQNCLDLYKCIIITGFHGPHDVHVGQAGDLACVPQHLKLHRGLDHTTLGDRAEHHHHYSYDLHHHHQELEERSTNLREVLK